MHLQRGELSEEEVRRRLPGRSANAEGKAWLGLGLGVGVGLGVPEP